jgi:hypothetical protein
MSTRLVTTPWFTKNLAAWDDDTVGLLVGGEGWGALADVRDGTAHADPRGALKTR